MDLRVTKLSSAVAGITARAINVRNVWRVLSLSVCGGTAIFLRVLYSDPSIDAIIYSVRKHGIIDTLFAIVIAGRLEEPISRLEKKDASYDMNFLQKEQDASTVEPLSDAEFYAEWNGHNPHHLATVHSMLKMRAHCDEFIFLMGDSSLDNKHYCQEPMARLGECGVHRLAISMKGAAVNGYDKVFCPQGQMVQDISYWLNHTAETRFQSGKVCTVMSAVEESTMRQRQNGLLAQDAFVRDRVGPNDVVIVSLGGNDVANDPTLRTAFNMYMLTYMPDWLIRTGWAPGFGYIKKLFFGQVLKKLLSEITSKQKPRKVIVAVIYYLDEKPGHFSTGEALRLLGYDENPAKLQLITRTAFEVVQRYGIDVPGMPAGAVEVFPLFETLDGKATSDYRLRVEPSMTGGRKLANALFDHLYPKVSEQSKQ